MPEQAEKLSAGQRSKVRRLSQPKEAEEGEEAGELNIVPFLDIIMNVLMFVLATVAVTFTATIDSTPPSLGGKGVRAQGESKALNLSLFIVDGGFSLKAAGGNIAPGCDAPGAGLAVPKVNNEYDYTTLTKCAQKLKDASPDFKDETQVTVTASPGIDYQTVIRAIDALRRAPEAGEDLFPDVHFGVPR
jgi:biopolymer transport protein TolR